MAEVNRETLAYRPGVGIMLVNADGKVFVGQRIDNRAEAWQMPQGGVDKGEDWLDAAWRELEEETGVARTKAELIAEASEEFVYELPDALIGVLWKGKYRGQRQRWYLMRFTGDDGDVDIATEHPEFREYAWKSPHELVELIVPFKRALYRRIVTEFSPLI
ncbi:MAG: RNA pyrophosphohydrolase [Sphingomonadales bacterium]|nr:RNA pyrophosphohydrolase [Sphingomonadales bacterium]